MKKLKLCELVERRKFRPGRHAALLADESGFVIADDDPDFPRVMKLYDLQLLYRSTEDDAERKQIVSAYAKLANNDDHFGHVALLSGLDWEYDKPSDECVLRVASAGYVRPDIKARVGRRVALSTLA